MSAIEEAVLKKWVQDSKPLRIILSSDDVFFSGGGYIRNLDDEEVTIVIESGHELRVRIRNAQKTFSFPGDAPKVIRDRVMNEQICQVEFRTEHLGLLMTEQA